MTENLLSMYPRRCAQKCDVTGLGSKEGREGWPGSLSGQNRLCSTGGAQAGWVGAGAAGSSIRHRNPGPGSVSFPSLPLPVPPLLSEGLTASQPWISLSLEKC